MGDGNQANLRLLWDFRLLDAALLTPSSEAAGYPAACLQDPLRCRTWRTAGLVGESLIIDLGQPAYCNCLGLVNHNFSLHLNGDGTYQAQIRVQSSNDPAFAAGAVLSDEIFDAWPPVIGFGEGGLGMHGFGGVILESERTFYLPFPIRVCYFTPVDGSYIQARYWRLLPADPANPDGFFAWGRLFLGLFEEFLWQVDYTGDHSFNDDTDNRRSSGGQRWPNRKAPYRGQRLPWALLSQPDLYWRLELFLLKVGLSASFIIDPYPDGLPSLRHYSLMYGHLVDFSEITGVSQQYRSAELHFEEDL